MDKNCTIFRTANFIGKKWTLIILLELCKGDNRWKRYSILKNGLSNITPKILSLRLKELGKEGLISKKIDTSKFPVKCEYSLTRAGKDFIRVIQQMKKWALKWKFNNKICENADCRECRL